MSMLFKTPKPGLLALKVARTTRSAGRACEPLDEGTKRASALISFERMTTRVY